VSVQTDRVLELLLGIGLSFDEAPLYLYLVKNGPNTALKISRDLHLARTKVYRILDKLEEKKLVNQQLQGRGLKFEADTYKNLELLLFEQENKLNSLKTCIPILYKDLEGLAYVPQSNSKILYYHGMNGLKQVTWNSLKAKGGLCLFELADMSAFLDYGFCEEVRQEFVNRGVHVRELSNLKKMPGWTNVLEFPKHFWSCRYIDPKKLKVRFEILIYNNVVCLYNYEGKEIFCVEIYDESLAKMQKQLFDFMWDNAKKMKILDEHGEATVLR